jgi:hypothetical protein
VVDDSVSIWRSRFTGLSDSTANEEIQWVIVDGFLLYWDKVMILFISLKPPE